jgi:hypothetical protein
MNKFVALSVVAMMFCGSAIACSIDFTINLETFGEGVTVELRTGTPGNSRIVKTQRSTGGTVFFGGLCPGSYFLAIGNGESVSVTPVRQFEDYGRYTSTLRMQRGSGNVSKKSRNAL